MSDFEFPLLPGDQVRQMLPCLSALVREIQVRGNPETDRLREILSIVPLRDEWACRELSLWARLLMQVRRAPGDRDIRATIREELLHRGVPDAQATLAVNALSLEAVGTTPLHQTSEPRRPEPPPRPQPPVGLRVHPVVVHLGDLAPGEYARGTFTVTGGSGRIRTPSNRVVVRPDTFGPGPTTVEVTVKGSRSDLVLLVPLTVQAVNQAVTVDVVASCAGLPPEPIVATRAIGMVTRAPSIPESVSPPPRPEPRPQNESRTPRKPAPAPAPPSPRPRGPQPTRGPRWDGLRSGGND